MSELRHRWRLLAPALAALLARGSLPAVAKKNKKVTLRHEGQIITVSKKKKKSHLKHGDTLGPCPSPPPPPTCVPTCDGRACGPTSCGNGSCGECGLCKTCEEGACLPKANGTPCDGACQECQNGTCVAKPAGTPCGACQPCQGVSCVSTCPSSQVCHNNVCEDLSGGCAAGINYCASGQRVTCTLFGTEGRCVAAGTGAPFCANQLHCSSQGDPICQSNADCVAMGLGAHAQCLPTCSVCGDTQPACVSLAGEPGQG